MKPETHDEAEEILALEAGLESLVPLFTGNAQLPASGDLLSRARLRQRELAAERLARWSLRIRFCTLAGLALAAAAISFATRSSWSDWLVARVLKPILEHPPLPGGSDAAVMAGAVLAASGAAIWVMQQFAEE